MEPNREFSICVLLYGNYPDLARRCLESIEQSLREGKDFVADIRLGLNAVAPPVFDYVQEWAKQTAAKYRLPVILFLPPHNVGKYPLMRRMFFQPSFPLANYVMWFDDDSYLTPRPGWWPRVHEAIRDAEMIGQSQWVIPAHGNQWEWVRTQPWFNPNSDPPWIIKDRPHFRFCQGAWWVIHAEILHRYDWPPQEFRHQGGDSLLGELLRQQGLRLGEFTEGVRVNADARGVHSAAPRRGRKERHHGADYRPGMIYPTNHQDFRTQIMRIAPKDAT